MACLSLRFASFLFGFLFVLKAPAVDCAASDHPGHYVVEDEVDVRGTRVLQALQAQTKNIDGARPRAGYMRKLMIGGKDMLGNRSPNPDIPDEFGMKKVTSKISAESHEDLKNSLGKLKDRRQYQMQEPKTMVGTSFATPRSSPHVTNTRPNHGKHSKTAALSATGSNFESPSTTTPQPNQETNQMSSSSHYSSEKNESDQINLIEAEKEIVGLMNRDYKGMGRRKPPIHNNQPQP